MLYFTGGSLLRSAKTENSQTGDSLEGRLATKDTGAATKLVDNILCKGFPGCRRILRVIRDKEFYLKQYVIITELGFLRTNSYIYI